MIDLSKMQHDVEGILIHSQDYPFDLDAENLINAWYQAKAPIIDRFGGATTLRFPQKIQFSLSLDERKARFKNFLSELEDLGVLTTSFETFLRNNEESFYENKVTVPYDLLDIKPNVKLSKSFKKFFYDEDDMLRVVQDTASRYMQENCIEGYLTLSVDPRDFLSLSENNEGWWSCHSLDSEFPAGNLSYMTDSVTLVAYLSSGKDVQLRSFPDGLLWNSKKWRMLVHTNFDTCIYFNRQYPYKATYLVDKTQEFVESLVPEYDFGGKEKRYECGFKKSLTPLGPLGLRIYQTNNQIYLGGRVFDAGDVVDTTDYLGYCDIVSSSTYSPVIALEREASLTYRLKHCCRTSFPLEQEFKDLKKLVGLKIGGKVPCPCCGQGTLATRGNMLVCPSCIEKFGIKQPFYMSCQECGRKIYGEEYEYDDGIYCKKCYNKIINEFKEELDHA